MSHAPSAVLSRRHHGLRQTLAEQDLDALVVTSLPNVLYLTNFAGSAAIVIVTAERLLFITDSRYATAMSEAAGTATESAGLEVVIVQTTYEETLAELLTRLNVRRVGFESAHVTVARYQWLERSVGGYITLVPTERLIEAVRITKDRYEINVLREAGQRITRVAGEVLSRIRPGDRERDVALAIDLQMREAGFDRPAFETIVASGPNSALPHARPTRRSLGEGDLVVLDFGGVYASYCVDLTRTISVGRASPRAQQVYAAVREAHDRAIAAVRPGATGADIDGAARQALAAHGMADAFGHGTGHGLGIEVHEEPRISRRLHRPGDADTAPDPARDLVMPGMVFTIEPGAYFAGFGGVRIEDDVLVTETGVDVLTSATTELVEI